MSKPVPRVLALDVSNRNGFIARAGSHVWTVPSFPASASFRDIVRAIPGPGDTVAHGGVLASEVHESAFLPLSPT